MKQKIPHYGIWFIRGQGGRPDVLLLPPTSHIIVDPKMDVDLWICGYSLLPDMHSPGRSLPAILLYVPLDLEQQKYIFLVLQVQVFKTKYAITYI